MNPTEDHIPRRLRALRILLGYNQQKTFAAALNFRGLSYDTIGDVERGIRELEPDERRAICEFAGVGHTWFEAPMSAMAPDGQLPSATTELRLDELLALVRDIQGRVSVLAPDPLAATDDARRSRTRPRRAAPAE